MNKIDTEIFKSLFFDYWKNIVIIVLAFFLFRSCQETTPSPQIVKVTVPEVKGTFTAQKPVNVPVGQKVSKGKTVYIANEIDPQLLAENISLKADFAKANDSIKKLQFAKAIQLNKFSSDFEDENVVININGIVQGEVKEITPGYKIKERKIEVPVKVKETVLRLLGGVEVANNIQLSNPIFKANLMLQNRKGNVLSGSYDSQKNIYLGYSFSIFNLKR